MLRILVALLIPSLVISSPALSQSFEQFERASQFEKAMAVVDQIRSRKKLQCLISVGNRSLCECLSTKLPFTLHISNYVSIANRDRDSRLWTTIGCRHADRGSMRRRQPLRTAAGAPQSQATERSI